MTLLGNGLLNANHNEDALSVQEAELSMRRRLGASEEDILVVQANLAMVYGNLGRLEEALSLRRDVYSGWLRLHGEEHEQTLRAANNYADTLVRLRRFEEAKSLLRKTIPLGRRVLEEKDELALKWKWNYASVLYQDPGATLDDLREAVTTLEDLVRTTRRVFGGAHPLTPEFESHLKWSREALAARETPSGSA